LQIDYDESFVDRRNFKFRLSSKNMRSQLVERARSVAAQVFHLPAEYFKASYDRTNVPELRKLLKFDDGNPVISKFAPVLYPDHSRSVRKDALLFQASEPALVCTINVLRISEGHR
jgi:hypothetical protein